MGASKTSTTGDAVGSVGMSRTPAAAAGLSWPRTFREAPKGERMEFSEDGARATRASGVGRAVAFLGPFEGDVAYFEVEVMELEASRTQTLALGVCEKLPSGPLLHKERAHELGTGTYLIGYDLPKLFVNGREVCKVNARQWRPLKELNVGDHLGLLVERDSMRLTVFVNGTSRVSMTMPSAPDGERRWEGELWGMVDVHGTVRSVRIQKSIPPPQKPDDAERENGAKDCADNGVASVPAGPRHESEVPPVPQLARAQTVAFGAAPKAQSEAAPRAEAPTAPRAAATAMLAPPPPAKKRRAVAGAAGRFQCGCMVHLMRHTGSVVHVPNEEFVIGRNPLSCNLTLDSPLVPNMVSRRHARIIANGDGNVMLVDCGSLNGTFVNDRAVQREKLGHSDVVVIGNPKQCPPEFCFTVSMPEDRQASA